MFTDSSSKEKEIDVTTFQQRARRTRTRRNEIEKITIEPRGHDDARYVITMQDTTPRRRSCTPSSPARSPRRSTTPASRTTVKSKDESSIWPQVLVWWLPMLLLVGIFFLFMRQLQSGGGKAMSFGKSKAKLLSRSPEPRDVQGRRRRRGGQGRGRGDHRVPQGSEEVHAPRRPHPQGRPDDGPAGHRQDAARARDRRRGGRAVLLDQRLGLRRDVRRRRRQPRPRPVRAGQEERAVHHLHRRDRRGRPPPRRRPRRRSRRARADAEPAARRDGRLRVQRRRHHHRRDQPPRRARPGAAAPGPLRSPHRRAAPRRARPRSASCRSTRARCRSPAASTSRSSRAARPGFSGADLENLVNEAALFAARRDKDKVEMERLRGGQGQGPDGRRARAR